MRVQMQLKWENYSADEMLAMAKAGKTLSLTKEQIEFVVGYRRFVEETVPQDTSYITPEQLHWMKIYQYKTQHLLEYLGYEKISRGKQQEQAQRRQPRNDLCQFFCAGVAVVATTVVTL